MSLDNVTVTLTLPVNAPFASYVNAVEMAHAVRVAQGNSGGAEALAMLAILCSRGHQALLADDMVIRGHAAAIAGPAQFETRRG